MEEMGAGRWVGAKRDLSFGSLDAGLIFKDLLLSARSQQTADISWGPGEVLMITNSPTWRVRGLFPLRVRRSH